MKIHVLIIHCEGKNISAFTAAETVEYLFCRVYHERGRFFRVKRTQPLKILSCPLQVYVFGYKIDNIDFCLYFIKCTVVIHYPILYKKQLKAPGRQAFGEFANGLRSSP